MPGKKSTSASSSNTTPVIPMEKKKKLLGFFLIVLALLVFLSILSYSGYDKANLTYHVTDIYKIFLDDPGVVSRAEDTHNLLGLVGAYISAFFVNSTIGYFSAFFPVILFIWGYVVFKGEKNKLPVYISTFLSLAGLMLASFAGFLRYEFQWFLSAPEISGKIGDFFGTVIGRLLGGLGGVIFFFALFVVTLILFFDVKPEVLLSKLKAAWDKFNKAEEKDERNTAEEEQEEEKPKPEQPRVPRTKVITLKNPDDDKETQVKEDEIIEEVNIAFLGEEEDKTPPPFSTPRVRVVRNEELEEEINKKPDFELVEEESTSQEDEIVYNETNDDEGEVTTELNEDEVEEEVSFEDIMNFHDDDKKIPGWVDEDDEGNKENAAGIQEEETKEDTEDESEEVTSQVIEDDTDIEIKDVPREPEIVTFETTEDQLEKATEELARNNEEVEDYDADKNRKNDNSETVPDPWDEKIKFNPPTIDLLINHGSDEKEISREELKRNAELLEDKLALFDIEVKVTEITPGPVVTLYEMVPAPGVKISKIVSLENDIALALAARGIRIIAPIPGKSAIGIEIPNHKPSIVSARSVLSKLKESKAALPLALGKTISGSVYTADLAKMPHLLIAGATGSGKSVGINMIISSLLFSKHPTEVKFAIVDPKKVEMSFYKRLSKHYLAVSPDIDEEIITRPANAVLLLKSLIMEMEQRYTKLEKTSVRNIIEYNNKISNPKARPKDTADIKHYKLPYIVVIIDELADLMMTSGKEIEEPIARLAQLARAVGIHVIVATQRPSVNVITGMIKANFGPRIAYQVASKIDSRTIIDMNGAERLLGRGDMLFSPGGAPKPERIQNAYISTEEVEAITNHIYVQNGFSKRFLLPSIIEQTSVDQESFIADLDPMFGDAARVIVTFQQGSVSLLQRRLKLGYSRAARIVDQLEQAGVVGPPEGSKAREVLIENEEDLEFLLRNL